MGFIFNINTEIKSEVNTKPVANAVNILKRDMKKVFNVTNLDKNSITLITDTAMMAESYKISVGGSVVITAGDDLGFVYALLHISEKYLEVKPFWFWMDQRAERTDFVQIPDGEYFSPEYTVRFRGWFFNDEVLLMKWKVNGDDREPWRMAFETLLRCGGNITIPGTDKNSRLNRQMAADMGLWITHHHAEPLGAEMFSRAYPNITPDFSERPELFYKLWEDAVIEQKDCQVVWNLCFRGQGDCPFWSHDLSGRYDTEEKRGALISSLIKKQCDIVRKYVDNPVFCTNLYGEIMELYNGGYIDLDDEIIKVNADNGYGRMVTRRRDNHSARVSSMPVKGGGCQGIYYHVSFYDLQAANHITMLANSVDFVDRELTAVLENDGNDFWVINCSNIRPHVYYLDAVRKKWRGEAVTDKTHSRDFVREYYDGDSSIAKAFCEYPKAMIAYGKNSDEHAGEQFYTENTRIIAHNLIIGNRGTVDQLKWVAGDGTLFEQTEQICGICRKGFDGIKAYFEYCREVSGKLSGNVKRLFDVTLFLQAKIHYYCAKGMIAIGDAVAEFGKRNYKEAFIVAGDGAEYFDKAQKEMRDSENGIWDGFYYNDCFADIKHSAYMMRKAMGYIREIGDNARHDKWYREVVYAPEDRDVTLLLVTDNHMTDGELYQVMKKEQK